MAEASACEPRKQTIRQLRYAVYGLFVAMALAYNFIIPLGYGPDEPRHEAYYRWIYQTGHLPTEEATTGAIVHHPPFYYLLCTPFFALFQHLGEPGRHLMRLVSTGLGLLVLVVTARILERLFPEEPMAPFFGIAGVAFLPHFLLISSVVSNDVAAAFWGALVLYMAVVLVQEGPNLIRGLTAGLCFGLGCFTKFSVAALGPLLPLAMLLGLRRRDGRWETSGLTYGIFGLLVAFLAGGGFWLLRFYLRFGRLEPEPPYPLWTWPDPRFEARLWRAIGGLFRSAWTQVDWFPPASRWPLYLFLLLFSLGAALGLCRLMWRRAREEGLRAAAALAMPLLGALILYAALLHSALYVHPGRYEGGRYWLPAVSGYMGLWLPAWRGWTKRAWAAIATAGVGLLAFANVLSYYWLIAYLNPTYGPK